MREEYRDCGFDESLPLEGTDKCGQDASDIAGGPWSDWTYCSSSCGGGHQKRTRPLNKAFEGCRVPEERMRCGPQVAADAFEDWGEWSACSASCGDGWEERARPLLRAYKACPIDEEARTQTRRCRISCSGHCAYGEWSAWTDCDATCGSGRRERQRVLLANPYGKPAPDCPPMRERTT